MTTLNSRGPVRGAPNSTPERVPCSLEPKSEYLRSVLEARRTKDAAEKTPSPAQPRPKVRRSASSTATTIDPWLEQAEEDMAHPTTGRRTRRPSEGAMFRVPTAREQQADMEKVRNDLINSKMKVELLGRQNSDLKDKLDIAVRRIEELEPLEDENTELREENDRFRMKVQEMDEEIIALEDTNAELLQIEEEAVAGMVKQQAGLEEAADVIIRLETEKDQLQAQMEQLKEELESCKSSFSGSEKALETFDGQPARVHSIDDSRPSTSHFDSDYYSQSEASPRVKMRQAKDSTSYAVRAQEHLAIGRRSVHELKKRSSDISLKSTGIPKGKASNAQIPTIAESYNDTVRAIQPITTTRSASRASQRRRPITPQTPSTLPQSIPTVPSTPTTPSGRTGLRGRYQTQITTSRNSRPPSFKSPNPSKHSDHSIPRTSTTPRRSDTQSPRSSTERLSNLSREQLSSAGDSLSPPSPVAFQPTFMRPVSSVADTDDTVTRPDSQRWWKDAGKVRTTANGQLADLVSPQRGLPPANFLFNAAEDEEAFLRKANSYMGLRKS